MPTFGDKTCWGDKSYVNTPRSCVQQAPKLMRTLKLLYLSVLKELASQLVVTRMEAKKHGTQGKNSTQKSWVVPAMAMGETVPSMDGNPSNRF